MFNLVTVGQWSLSKGGVGCNTALTRHAFKEEWGRIQQWWSSQLNCINTDILNESLFTLIQILDLNREVAYFTDFTEERINIIEILRLMVSYSNSSSYTWCFSLVFFHKNLQLPYHIYFSQFDDELYFDQSMAQAATQPRSSPVVDRNLHDILRDTPAMNESSKAVHSGTTPPTPQRGYSQHPASLPLSNSTCKFSQLLFSININNQQQTT